MAGPIDPNKCREAIYSEQVADYILGFTLDIERFRPIRPQYDIVCSQDIMGQFSIVYQNVTGSMSNVITPSLIADFYQNIPKLYGLMDTSNLEDMGVYKLRRLPYLDLYGSRTLIGIIDTGIDYTNPLFINADGTSRIAAVWDQTIQTGPAPNGVYYGTEYNKEDIDRALKADNPKSVVPTEDENGHGTFVAAIAGGNIDDKNEFSGVAPQAEFVVVKLKPAKKYLRDFFGIEEDAVAFQENDIMLGVQYLRMKAIELNHPISICIGLGTNSGAHEGASYFSSYLDFISIQPGLCICTAAGNEGNAGHHYSGSLESGANEDVELKVSEKQKNLVLEIWSKTPTLFSIALISPSGEIQERIPAKQGLNASLSFTLEPTVIRVTYSTTNLVTGNEMVLIQFRDLVPGIWRIRVYNDSTIGANYDMWIPISVFVDDATYFLRPDPYITLVETGTTVRPISTATYDHKGNSIYISSSRGYTLSGQVKPEITAPGVNVYGPVSKTAFGEKSGSSIAAAHAAGVAALFLQWGIVEKKLQTMNTIEIKSLYIRGAVRGSIEYPNREWGYGVLNAFNAFESERKTV